MRVLEIGFVNLNSGYRSMKKQVRELERAKEAIGLSLADSEREREAAKESIKEALEKERGLLEEFCKLKAELQTTKADHVSAESRAKAEADARESETSRLRAELEAALKVSADRQAQIDRQKKLMSQASGERDQLREQVLSFEKDRKATEERLAVAEQERLNAVEAVGRAVESFMESEAFRAEVLGASSQCYWVGHNDCRALVAKHYPELSLDMIPTEAPEEDEEEEEEEPGAIASEPRDPHP